MKVAGIVQKLYQKGPDSILVIGEWRVYLKSKPAAQAGDRVSVIGSCKRGVTEFLRGEIGLVNPSVELKDEAVAREPIFFAAMRKLREGIAKIYRQQLPTREAALLAGIVLGDKSGISPDFKDELINSGTIHVAVASGYNVTVVAMSIMALFGLLVSRRVATMAGMIGIFFYILLAGAEAPVIRAGIMGGMVLLSKSLGRQAEAKQMLFAASYLWYWPGPRWRARSAFSCR